MKDGFRLNYELTDYGKLQLEIDESLNELDMSSQKRKAMFKNPVFYYMLLLVLLLVVWFVGSLIANAVKYGFAKSIGMHASGFFVMAVMCLIVLLSVFGGWNKFLRWASRRNLADVKGFNQSERERRDTVERKKNRIAIYEDWLVITNYGWTSVYDMSLIEQVKLESADKKNLTYRASFVSAEGEVAKASADIPREKALFIQLKKIFGKRLKIKNNIAQKRAIVTPNKPVGTVIGLTLFVSVFIAAGIGIICLHYYLEPSIPVFLGAFFILVGCIAMCGVYDFVPLLKDIFVPILFGVVFTAFPIFLIKTIYQSSGAQLTFKSIIEVFTPIGAAALFFVWFGLLFVLIGIKTSIDYIRYEINKNK